MAMTKKVSRKKVVELEEKTEKLISDEEADGRPENTSPVTEPIITTTTTATRKRSRNTDKEQKPNNRREKQKLNKHGGKPEPIKKRVATFGNYDRYYGYRVCKDSDDDPRIKYFKQEWFRGKDCLDVGCNTGNLTITIAKKFACKSMVGVDIDLGLVNKARKLLKVTAKNIKANQKLVLDLDHLNGKTSPKTSSDMTLNTSDIGLSSEELLKSVSFEADNFVSHMEVKPTFDTVLCLSVTKWVHLNWGDDGLIKLFAKIRNLLRPGGVLVLEPQAWKSYKSNHLVSEVVQRNFHEIVLRPEQFKEVLLDRVGFRSMQSITNEVAASVKGFNRPIYLVQC